jgi:hypothetical protein
MTDNPRVRALLTELLQLGVEDAQLPLPVIVNLNRRALAAPFERFGAEVAPLPAHDKFAAASSHVAHTWAPISGDLFRDHALLDALSTQGPDDVPESVAAAWPKELALICQNALWHWVSYEPLVQLCTFAWSGTNLPVAFQMLEIELGLEPKVQEMLLHYGKDEMSRA